MKSATTAIRKFNKNNFFSLKISKTEILNPGYKINYTIGNYSNMLLALQRKEIHVIPKIGYYNDTTDVFDILMPFWKNR